MLKSSARSAIRLRGVRQNNLKNFDLDLPLKHLIVITGLSGSGKSSLAFETLFAEGQRRYIETFSPYARQFFDRMDKPQVDSIEGIPPAIAIEQRNSVRSTRSTVGTMTEICEHMKLLWPHISALHCRGCGRRVIKEPPQVVWQAITSTQSDAESKTGGGIKGSEALVTFTLPISEKLSRTESLELVAKQGYQRLLLGGAITRIDEVLQTPAALKGVAAFIVVQDRVKLAPENRARFVEACEQAYHFGKGKLAVYALPDLRHPRLFSNLLHCAECDIEYREPSPALFSFNHPVGACPKCRGFGRVISIDYDLAVPDWCKTLVEGVVKPWQSGQSAECQTDLLRMCREYEIPTDVPFNELPEKWQRLVIDGEPDYGIDEDHEWPKAWYGVKGYFRWLESKAYKMHVRVLLSRYRAYTPCPDCAGKRFNPDSLLYRAQLGEKTTDLAEFYQLPAKDALSAVERIVARNRANDHDPIQLALGEVRWRLRYLNEVGLGYVTLDRPTRSLSGGETERVNLTTCLGTRLVNTLYILDEPSVGLHPRDTQRLIRILEQLRDAGNTVVVVEHESSVMRAADQIVDLGPGHGSTGGEVVFQGSFSEMLESTKSLTGQYLSGRKRSEAQRRRPVSNADKASSAPESRMRVGRGSTRGTFKEASAPFRVETPFLRLSHATRHNLKDLSVSIPLRRLVCVTGVSGSGKTTLVREVLLPALSSKIKAKANAVVKASDRLSKISSGEDDEEREATPAATACLEGAEHLEDVVLVDQSTLGKTPRSNPAVYIGAFDDIREFFGESAEATRLGLAANAFSFNSAIGQCERCRGAGFEKIEMQFLSDVFIRCPSCNGRRYRQHILDVKLSLPAGHELSPQLAERFGSFSIADILDAPVEDVQALFAQFRSSRPAQRAARSLALLTEVGLGYLSLGQPINTLSGGESQRLKLVRRLAEVAAIHSAGGGRAPRKNGAEATAPNSRLLFLFDEPTTGLHFDDVRVLLNVFHRLVDSGHSVMVIEHNLEVIRSADWIIDLGPEAGEDGGKIVAEGTPEEVADCKSSHTGRALRQAMADSEPEAAHGALAAAR